MNSGKPLFNKYQRVREAMNNGFSLSFFSTGKKIQTAENINGKLFNCQLKVKQRQKNRRQNSFVAWTMVYKYLFSSARTPVPLCIHRNEV